MGGSITSKIHSEGIGPFLAGYLHAIARIDDGPSVEFPIILPLKLYAVTVTLIRLPLVLFRIWTN